MFLSVHFSVWESWEAKYNLLTMDSKSMKTGCACDSDANECESECECDLDALMYILSTCVKRPLKGLRENVVS